MSNSLPTLEKLIRKKTVPKVMALLLCLSVLVVASSVYLSITSLKNLQEIKLNDFSVSIQRKLESFQTQISNLALNEFIVNSVVDFSTHDTYLPIFFRSLRVSGVDNVSIIYTDFSGEVITGNNVEVLKEQEHYFEWHTTVLEHGKPYFKHTEHGIFSAVPIIYANSAEAALLAYVPNLQSMLGNEFIGDDTFVLATAKGRVLFSNQTEIVAKGTQFSPDLFDDYFVARTNFMDGEIYSLKATSKVYADVAELATLILLALFVVLIFTIYSIRLASMLATRSLNELQQSIELLVDPAKTGRKVLKQGEEPVEFHGIRQQFMGVVENLIDTSISRNKFLNIINSLDEMLLVVDFDGNIILHNERVDALMQKLALNESSAWKELFPVEFLNMMAANASADEQAITQKYRLKVDGKECVTEIAWHNKFYKNEDGELLGHVISGDDISREKHLQAELLIRTQAIEEAPSPIVISDAVTRNVTYVNKAFTRLTGYRPEEMIGRNCKLLQGKETNPEDINTLRSAIKEEKPTSVTILNYKKDGSSFYNRVTLNPIFNDEGVMTQIVGLQIDVTERAMTERYLKQAKEKAEDSTRLKSDFLASMSHEIRTPMNGVLGMLSLLTSSELSEEQMRRATIAQSSAESLLALINDILDFSKVEAGKLELEALDFDITQMLGEFVDSVALSAQEKGLELVLDTSEIKFSQVKGDSGRIRQVFTNIIGNAIKFTQSGEILIKVSVETTTKNVLTLSGLIRDTGIGIPAGKIENLFDSFSQVDASTTRKYGGTGLGLAIVKKLCQLMSGDIIVSSEAGQGSSFNFSIQLQHADTPEVCLKFSDLSVLIVDDNQTSRMALRAQLESWGVSVHDVSGGQQALQDCKTRLASHQPPFDIVFLDSEMPDMDGLMLGEALLKDALYSQMKLVMMTPMNRELDEFHFNKLGFLTCFSKPVTAFDLSRTINLALGNAALSTEAQTLSDQTYTESSKHSTMVNLERSEWVKKVRILLVEDNKINQLVALGVLEHEGIVVEVAENGLEALNKLSDLQQEIPYGLVLMDCQMPVMDGYEATQAIRRGETGEANLKIPVIAMTANAMKGDREKCLEVGMNDYLPKPINPANLLAMLERWLVEA